ncbi:MAG: AI-2E family transporter [Desulfovibrio sp.]|nr:AI-2E family transporter [Desulfovibrio sp.]
MKPHPKAPRQAHPRSLLPEAGPPRRKTAADSRQSWAGEDPTGRKIFLWSFLLLLIFSFYLLYTLLLPLLNTIILGIIFSAICYPLYRRCLGLTGHRAIPAALLVIACLMFLVILPISLFIIGLLPQASQSVSAVTRWLQTTDPAAILNFTLEPLLTLLKTHFPELDLHSLDFKQDMISISSQMGQYLIASGTYILRNTAMFIGHLCVIFLFMFFALIDGEKWLRRLEYLLPIKPEQTSVVMENLRRMSRAVLVGGFCVAALQGIAGGVGFALVGIPALFWGTVMAFAALVPVFGTGLVWGPAVLILFLSGEWKSALFLLLWCGIGVTSIDSILRPLLLRDGARVSVLFIFLSILSGIMTFGMLGLLYGPIILGLVVVMLDIYSQEYKSILEARSLKPFDSATPPSAHNVATRFRRRSYVQEKWLRRNSVEKKRMPGGKR